MPHYRMVAPFLYMWEGSDTVSRHWTWRSMLVAYQFGSSYFPPCFDAMCPQYDYDADGYVTSLYGVCPHTRLALPPLPPGASAFPIHYLNRAGYKRKGKPGVRLIAPGGPVRRAFFEGELYGAGSVAKALTDLHQRRGTVQ